MLATKIAASRLSRRVLIQRAFASHVKGEQLVDVGPIGKDGRHEIWREDIYDHDNEPR